MEDNDSSFDSNSPSGKMSIAQFEESFLMFIPESLVSNADIDNNNGWFDTLVHDAWRLYIRSNVDHGFIFLNMQNMMYTYKRYNPKFED